MEKATMKASELKAKLGRDLSASRGAISSMEAERMALALPAHSGDEAAMLRVVELRSDIEGKRPGLRDLEQALVDIEPAVLVEQATDRLQRRERLHGQYRASCSEVATRMAAIDAAVSQLAVAFQDAAAPLERARHLAVELMAPARGSSSDIGRMAEQRMIMAQNIGIQSVGDLIETALEDVHVLYRQVAPFPLRPDTRLSDEMARTLAAVDVRVREAMADDRRASVQAGAVLDPVAA